MLRYCYTGESAGGASVHYQMLSPKSKGLFSRAIRQSGSALNYWTMYRQSKEQARYFAKQLNCPVDNSKDMVKCLKELDASTLVQPHIQIRVYRRNKVFYSLVCIKDIIFFKK